MDIQDIRRENLRKWAKKNGTPPKEKSYFSQLLGGATFGEKAARRLEEEYGMGAGYLDKAPSTVADTEGHDLDDAIRLLALYRSSSLVGRKFIMTAAESAERLPGQPE